MISNHDLLGYTDDNLYIIKCPHKNCDKCHEKFFTIPKSNYISRRYFNIETCTKLLPIKGSRANNTSIEIFIRNILDDLNIKYITNKRGIIPPYELDVFIPDKNIAIECNGSFWHSTYKKKPNYHLNKFIKCSDKNIKLITLWEDWIRTKPYILEMIIRSEFDNYQNIINARDCEIVILDDNLCSAFLADNNLYNEKPFDIGIGLMYKNNVVSLMTFLQNGQIWNLIQFCNILGTNVSNSYENILSYFIKQYKPQSIITCFTNDFDNKHLIDLGFKPDTIYNPKRWFVNKYSYERIEYEPDDKDKFYEMFDSGFLKYTLNFDIFNSKINDLWKAQEISR